MSDYIMSFNSEPFRFLFSFHQNFDTMDKRKLTN